MKTAALMVFAAALAAAGGPQPFDGAQGRDAPEARGISSRYPGDAGIERDPDVLLSELNEVGKADGEQRLWINGRLVVEQTGMEWRKTDQLVLNTVMLSTNTSSPPKPGTRRTLWIDGVVLAKRYVGPMQPAGTPDRK